MGKGALELLPSIRNLLDDLNHSNEATLQSVWPSVKFRCPAPVRYLLGLGNLWNGHKALLHLPDDGLSYWPQGRCRCTGRSGDQRTSHHGLLWSGPKQ